MCYEENFYKQTTPKCYWLIGYVYIHTISIVPSANISFSPFFSYIYTGNWTFLINKIFGLIILFVTIVCLDNLKNVNNSLPYQKLNEKVFSFGFHT